jgi:predicted nucleic acid-binding protein
MAPIGRRRPQNRPHLFAAGLIIAATAIEHDLTVVTRDRSGYDKARVSVLNPWET